MSVIKLRLGTSGGHDYCASKKRKSCQKEIRRIITWQGTRRRDSFCCNQMPSPACRASDNIVCSSQQQQKTRSSLALSCHQSWGNVSNSDAPSVAHALTFEGYILKTTNKINESLRFSRVIKSRLNNSHLGPIATIKKKGSLVQRERGFATRRNTETNLCDFSRLPPGP